MSTTAIAIIVAVIAIAAVAGAWFYMQSRRRVHLRERFGPEYEETVHRVGDSRRAEATLAERERRVEKYKIRPLSPEDKVHYGEAWRHVQALFVDDPNGAIIEADRLVNDVMTARGYPMADFDQRAADVSVDHGHVVEHYRAAHAIAVKHGTGSATTEDLRQAMIHYRALFDDLLETKAATTSTDTRARELARR